MRALTKLLGAACLCGLAWSAPVAADTIRGTYDDTQADPAETFDEDCLGETPADDCDARATLIEAELVTLLARLESDEDPATLALFQAALELESPIVQAMAARYLERAEREPEGFMAKVREFLFGADAPRGATAASILRRSSDETDQQLGKLFEEQRSSYDYSSLPVSDRDDYRDDSLVQACVRDARFTLASSFSEDDRYQPASRLLVYDRMVASLFNPTQDYPVSAFATDDSLEDVSAFFTERFGEPLGPIAGSEERLVELQAELLELQGAAAGGDRAAIDKMQALVAKLEEAQQLVTLGAYLQLTPLHAENDLVWLDGKVTDVLSGVRAVTVGEDPLIGKTVIRYLNAAVRPADGKGGTSNGDGDGDGSAGAPAGPGEPLGEGGAASDPARAGDDSGCGCAIPGAPQAGGPRLVAVALALAGAGLLRARRRRSTARI